MRGQSRPRVRFAVCIKNKGYEASLERGKVYRMIPDAEAAKHGYVRIVDESGEDYGYSAELLHDRPSEAAPEGALQSRSLAALPPQYSELSRAYWPRLLSPSVTNHARDLRCWRNQSVSWLSPMRPARMRRS
jgi:hypothetical protein